MNHAAPQDPQTDTARSDPTTVVTVADCGIDGLRQLFSRFGLRVDHIPDGQAIAGSYWGEREAGLLSQTLYVRSDTPLHSALHEGCHFVCMDRQRRAALATDAGGDYDEENGVCYLQIVLADEFPTVRRAGMMRDMDAWGYTFRLGSAQAWFEQDADDALRWLKQHGILGEDGRITWKCRQ